MRFVRGIPTALAVVLGCALGVLVAIAMFTIPPGIFEFAPLVVCAVGAGVLAYAARRPWPVAFLVPIPCTVVAAMIASLDQDWVVQLAAIFLTPVPCLIGGVAGAGLAAVTRKDGEV